MNCQQVIDIYKLSCIKVEEDNIFLAPKATALRYHKHANCLKSMELLETYCKEYTTTTTFYKETGN
jgi:hypothetical protein